MRLGYIFIGLVLLGQVAGAQNVYQKDNVVKSPSVTIASSKKTILTTNFAEIFSPAGQYVSTKLVVTLMASNLKKLAPDFLDGKEHSTQVKLMPASFGDPILGTLTTTLVSEDEGGTLKGTIDFGISPTAHNDILKRFSQIIFSFSGGELKLDMIDQNYFNDAVFKLYYFKPNFANNNTPYIQKNEKTKKPTQHWPSELGAKTFYNYELGWSYKEVQKHNLDLETAQTVSKAPVGSDIMITDTFDIYNEGRGIKYFFRQYYRDNQLYKINLRGGLFVTPDERIKAWKNLEQEFTTLYGTPSTRDDKNMAITWVRGNYKFNMSQRADFLTSPVAGLYEIEVSNESFKSWTDNKKFDANRFEGLSYPELQKKAFASHEISSKTIVPEIDMNISMDTLLSAFEKLRQSGKYIKHPTGEVYQTKLGNTQGSDFYFKLIPEFADGEMQQLSMLSVLHDKQTVADVKKQATAYLTKQFGTPFEWTDKTSGGKILRWFDGENTVSLVTVQDAVNIHFEPLIP